jgi:hypothetical protein
MLNNLIALPEPEKLSNNTRISSQDSAPITVKLYHFRHTKKQIQIKDLEIREQEKTLLSEYGMNLS